MAPSIPPLSLQFCHPDGNAVSNHQVDAWELKCARRALLNLRTLLLGQPMRSLIQPQVDEAEGYYRSIIKKSNGKYKESRIDVHVQGISVDEFLAWHRHHLETLTTQAGRDDFFLKVMVPAHPEHYRLPDWPVGITETIGEHIAQVRLHNDTPIPDEVLAFADPSYRPVTMVGSLEGGSVLFYVLQEFKDIDDGAHFKLRLLFPEAAPQVLFDEHAEHLAVEFRSFIAAAYEWKEAAAKPSTRRT